MRVLRLLSLALLACGLSAAARADVLNYNVVFTPFGLGGGGVGTFSVDDMTGLLTAADFNFSGVEFTLADQASPSTYDSSGLSYGGIVISFLPIGVVIGNDITTDVPGQDYVIVLDNMGVVEEGSLSITPVSATPEPSSFALLGTGVLGTVGMVRRRYRHA